MRTEIDPIDRMLDAAAPRGVDDSVALRSGLTAMLADARRAARPKRRRGGRVALGAGLVAVLVGGAGAAVAATAFEWAPWAQDPDVVYAFELPSGRACEARVQVLKVTSTDENGRRESKSDTGLTEHFRSIDAIGRIDMEEAIAYVHSLPDAMVVVHPDGSMSDAPRTAEGMSADDVYAFAVDMALRWVLRDEFDALGWSDDEWSSNEHLQCEAIGE